MSMNKNRYTQIHSLYNKQISHQLYKMFCNLYFNDKVFYYPSVQQLLFNTFSNKLFILCK